MPKGKNSRLKDPELKYFMEQGITVGHSSGPAAGRGATVSGVSMLTFSPDGVLRLG